LGWYGIGFLEDLVIGGAACIVKGRKSVRGDRKGNNDLMVFMNFLSLSVVQGC
jgi:hypothetical protein